MRAGQTPGRTPGHSPGQIPGTTPSRSSSQSSARSSARLAFGLDFGTTNTSLARAVCVPGERARVDFARYPSSAGETASFRSLLYLEQPPASAQGRVKSWAGPAAIERYLEHAAAGEGRARLIQSLKSYLTSRTLTGTEIFGRHYLLEDLISRILREVREGAERQFGAPIEHVVVGRPVRFVGQENGGRENGGQENADGETNEDARFALNRLTQALHLAGFASVEFEYEPVGAAYAYEAALDHQELLLIGDFGGGTSDFSLLRVGPGVPDRQRLLGTGGVGLAGDAFDAKLVRKLVSPALGADSLARSFGKLLPAVPAWIYANLERWHYLSFLRTRNVLEILQGARIRALEPEKIEALLTLIDEDLGYQLHQAVQRVKYALSHQDSAEFAFRDGSMDLRLTVTRAQFEGWIAEELAAIEQSVDALLARAGVSAGDVDRVFLTGGTSFVPAVRRIFRGRFGTGGTDESEQDRVRTGDAFTSVAHGLALRGLARG